MLARVDSWLTTGQEQLGEPQQWRAQPQVETLGNILVGDQLVDVERFNRGFIPGGGDQFAEFVSKVNSSWNAQDMWVSKSSLALAARDEALVLKDGQRLSH